MTASQPSVVVLWPHRDPAIAVDAEVEREAARLTAERVSPVVRESEAIAGLVLERHGRFVTVRCKAGARPIWARYFVTGGRAYVLDGSTLGTWPTKVARIVEPALAAYAAALE